MLHSVLPIGAWRTKMDNTRTLREACLKSDLLHLHRMLLRGYLWVPQACGTVKIESLVDSQSYFLA